MNLKFVGVGPQRTGTTWLYTFLRKHPQLCFPRGVKETFFFDKRFHRGWSWYCSHFKNCSKDQFCGEMASTYFDVPEATSRIHKHNPDCRIIVSLRDPATRSFSLYLHHRNIGDLNCDFSEAIRKIPRIIYSSRYHIHLSRWIEAFGPEQIFIVLLDDIASFPERILTRLYEFLEIASIPMSPSVSEPVNVATLPAFPVLTKVLRKVGKWLRDRRIYAPVQLAKRSGIKRVCGGLGTLPTLESETKRRLIQEFEPDIAYVEDLLGRNLQKWREHQLH